MLIILQLPRQLQAIVSSPGIEIGPLLPYWKGHSIPPTLDDRTPWKSPRATFGC